MNDPFNKFKTSESKPEKSSSTAATSISTSIHTVNISSSNSNNLRSGKLSLSKRRRDKRKINDAKESNSSDGKQKQGRKCPRPSWQRHRYGGSSSGSSSTRSRLPLSLPIPSFSPLDENCDVIKGVVHRDRDEDPNDRKEEEGRRGDLIARDKSEKDVLVPPKALASSPEVGKGKTQAINRGKDGSPLPEADVDAWCINPNDENKNIDNILPRQNGDDDDTDLTNTKSKKKLIIGKGNRGGGEAYHDMKHANTNGNANGMKVKVMNQDIQQPILLKQGDSSNKTKSNENVKSNKVEHLKYVQSKKCLSDADVNPDASTDSGNGTTCDEPSLATAISAKEVESAAVAPINEDASKNHGAQRDVASNTPKSIKNVHSKASGETTASNAMGSTEGPYDDKHSPEVKLRIHDSPPDDNMQSTPEEGIPNSTEEAKSSKNHLLVQDPNQNQQPNHNHNPSKRANTRTTTARTKLKRTTKSTTLRDAFQFSTISSPSMDDFNVPRGKLLNDREADLKREHADLLQQSKTATTTTTRPHPQQVDHCDEDDSTRRVSKRRRTKRSNHSTSSSHQSSSYFSKTKLCTMCSTCNCSRGSALQSLEDTAISEHQNPLQKLARSDAEIERALIGRLARLEKSASWFDQLCTKVSRELTRHRNRIKGKLEKRRDGVKKPTFLRDVEDAGAGAEDCYSAPAISTSFATRAKNRMFSFRKKAQPTLTQMMKGDSDTEDEAVKSEFDKVDAIIEEGEEDEIDAEGGHHSGEQIDNNSNLYPNNAQAAEDVDVEINYDEAYQRGKTRSLWKASRMSQDQFQSSNLKQEFDPTSQTNKLLEMEGQQLDDQNDDDFDDVANDGLSELLNVFDSIDDENRTNDEDVTNEAAMMDVYICSPTINGILSPNASKGSSWHMSTPITRKGDPSFNHNPANFSQLTPASKSTFARISSKISSTLSPSKMVQLNQECPNWEENIRYSLLQSSTDLSIALENVRAKRERVKRAKEMLERQETVLGVFDMALVHSLGGNDDINTCARRVDIENCGGGED